MSNASSALTVALVRHSNLNAFPAVRDAGFDMRRTGFRIANDLERGSRLLGRIVADCHGNGTFAAFRGAFQVDYDRPA